MILMINPSIVDKIQIDFSILYTLNNLTKLAYSLIGISNLYSTLGRLKAKDESQITKEEIIKYFDIFIETIYFCTNHSLITNNTLMIYLIKFYK